MNDSPKRVVARVLAREVLATFGQIADRYGLDLIDTLVFTGVWTANTAHLSDPQVYAGIFDVPPDEARRPVSRAALAAQLRMEAGLLDERLARLMAGGVVVETEEGLSVPAHVLGRDEMVDGVELTYVRTLQLVQTLDRFGVVAEVQ